jgi:hypothetical protein
MHGRKVTRALGQRRHEDRAESRQTRTTNGSRGSIVGSASGPARVRSPWDRPTAAVRRPDGTAHAGGSKPEDEVPSLTHRGSPRRESAHGTPLGAGRRSDDHRTTACASGQVVKEMEWSDSGSRNRTGRASARQERWRRSGRSDLREVSSEAFVGREPARVVPTPRAFLSGCPRVVCWEGNDAGNGNRTPGM